MGKIRFVVLSSIILLSTGIYMTRNFLSMAVVSMVEFDNSTVKSYALYSLAYSDWGHVGDPFPHLKHEAQVFPLINEEEECSIYQSIVNYIHRLCSQRFAWDTSVIAQIQGAFYLGYILLQMEAASLSNKHGGRMLLLASVLFSSISALIGPFVAHNKWMFFISRFICGLSQSCFLPAAFVVIMNWLPRSERTLGLASISIAASIGTILIYFSSGFISTSLGWPYLFWIAALYGIVTCLISYAFLYSKPEDHPFISPQELSHIAFDLNEERGALLSSPSLDSVLTASIDVNANNIEVASEERIKQQQQRQQQQQSEQHSTPAKVPWRSILANKSVLAIFFWKMTRQFNYAYGGSFGAIFNKTIIKMSPEMNGIVSSILAASHLLLTIPLAILSERLIANGLITRTKLRRISCVIDGCGIGVCHALIPFIVVYGTTPMFLTVIVIQAFFGAFVVVAEGPISREMSKNFGHAIFALLNVLSVSAIIIYPTLISLVLQITGSSVFMNGWYIIHWILSIVALVGCIPYAFFASSERQTFDYISS